MCTPGGQQSGNPGERYPGIFLCILSIDKSISMWYNGRSLACAATGISLLPHHSTIFSAKNNFSKPLDKSRNMVYNKGTNQGGNHNDYELQRVYGIRNAELLQWR